MPTTSRTMPGTARRRLFAATGVALGLVLATDASAARDARCTTHGAITKQLEQRYGETPVSLGLSSAGKLVQVFSTDDGATWTLVLTRPDGVSCIVAAGRHWQSTPPEPRGPEA